MESLSSSISSSVVKVKLGDQWKEEAPEGSLPWDDGGGYTGIRSITIGFSGLDWVQTIQVEYDLFGKSVLGQKRGTDYINVWKQKGTTIEKKKWVVDFPGELVTGVYWNEMSEGRIYDLELRTNRRRMELQYFGKPAEEGGTRLVEGGTAGGAIVGFFGRSDGKSLGSIGVYMAVLCPTTAAGDLLDELHHQGLMPYRTSPLALH